MSTSYPSPAVAHPLDVEMDRLLDEEHDTVAETRPLPDLEPSDRRAERPDLLPTIGHIGRYALKYTIGEGGLGTVYAAHDPLLSRLIAIKTLHVDLPQADHQQFNELFLNEAKAAGSLNHPNIVTVYDAGTSPLGTYIAMELLRGKDLRQLMKVGWVPTPPQAALIMRRVADALTYAHHRGVIHRDIKPANIFMVGRTQPRVLDFGIARIRQVESLVQRDDPQHRIDDMVGGSPYYMAPELVRNEPVDQRVDVYALGVVLYELLTSCRAFSGNSLEEIVDAVQNKAVPPVHVVNPQVPLALSEIVAKAMHRDPAQRIKSARRLAQELRAWLDSSHHRAHNATLNGRKGKAAPLSSWWSVIKWGAVTTSALLMLSSVVAWRMQPPESAAAARKALVTKASAKPVVVAGLASTPQAPNAAKPTSASTPAQAPHDAAASMAANAGHKVVVANASSNAKAKPVVVARQLVSGGWVHLAISPWGEVSVDGRRVGVTPPLSHLSLTSGRHTIVVRNGDAPAFQQSVMVQAGEPVSLQHQF